MHHAPSDSNTESDKDKEDEESADDHSDAASESEDESSDSDVSDANMYETEEQQNAWTPCDKTTPDWVKFQRVISDCFGEHINERVRLKDQQSAIER